MSRIVFHPLTSDPILVAPERSERPGAWGAPESSGATTSDACPFCPGNEDETPPEIMRHADGAEWHSRVVPNKYPALAPVDGVPSHEVLIETPAHDSPLESRDASGWLRMLELWRERVIRHAARPGIQSVLLFRNEGRGAGQSIAHPHSQLLAMPFVTPRLSTELRTFTSSETCPLCSYVALVAGLESLVVERRNGMVTLCPRAPRLPFESWVVPERHEPDWCTESMEAIATSLRTAVRALRSRWPEVPFNLVLQSATPRAAGHHWHIEILPRLTSIAGFELATGAWMNIVEPERAASELRASLSP